MMEKINHALHKKQRLIAAVKAIFDNKQNSHGQVFLRHILDRCYVTTPLLAGNPTTEQIRERAALQNFALDILRTANLSEEALQALIETQPKERNII